MLLMTDVTITIRADLANVTDGRISYNIRQTTLTGKYMMQRRVMYVKNPIILFMPHTKKPLESSLTRQANKQPLVDFLCKIYASSSF